MRQVCLLTRQQWVIHKWKRNQKHRPDYEEWFFNKMHGALRSRDSLFIAASLQAIQVSFSVKKTQKYLPEILRKHELWISTSLYIFSRWHIRLGLLERIFIVENGTAHIVTAQRSRNSNHYVFGHKPGVVTLNGSNTRYSTHLKLAPSRHKTTLF